MRDICLPINDKDTLVANDGSFVIIGANGSGKSHLGAWIEKHNENVLRISAQRALNIPDSITIKSENTAWSKLCYGDEIKRDKGFKWQWGNETTTLVNDYDSVLTCIFARQNKENDAYVKDCKEKESRGEAKSNVPPMIMDQIYSIWNSVFPQRNIIFEDAQVRAQKSGSEAYHAKHMSDGERVAIYLIGQCLVAPADTIIVIDEPEIHLHKSIMHSLWDKIEEKCSDKTFVYITHDLDFASSRKDANKIWIKSFDGNKWEMQLLQEEESIPEALLYEILGGRKPVLLVEGDKGSYDCQLYPYLYPNYNVIPCHNCTKVIELTKAFRNERVINLHTNSVNGLIDHDYLTDVEIKKYKTSGIFTLQVAEIENLYLVEDVVRLVADHLKFDSNQKFLEVKSFLFDEFKKEYDLQLAAMCTKEIAHKLRNFEKPAENTLDALQEQLQSIVLSVHVDEIYKMRKQEIDRIIDTEDYNGLLMVYNRKSLHNRVSSIMELRSYPQLVLRLLKSNKRDDILNAMKQFIPEISH